MKKILQINSVAGIGSTGRLADEIGQFASNAGWENYIAYGRSGAKANPRLIKIGALGSVLMHVVETRFFDRHGLGSKRATVRFINRIKEINPDIIHLHNIHGYYLNVSLLFKYFAVSKIPVIWTIHDCWPITGHCAFFDHIGCTKWKTQCEKCPQLGAYPESWLADRSYKNHLLKKKLYSYDIRLSVIAVSEWMRNVAENSILKSYIIKMIYNWVDTSVFKPSDKRDMIRSKYRIANKFLLLGVASKWCERKNLTDYLKLSRLLPDGFMILLVGLSKQQIRRLPDSVHAIPKTDSISDLAELYSAADAVLNLSLEESFGLTIVEGLACGTPGIVYNSTASPELITQENGFVVEKGDLNGVVAAAQLIKAKGKEYYKDRCINRAKSYFNKNDQISKYLDLYESVLCGVKN